MEKGTQRGKVVTLVIRAELRTTSRLPESLSNSLGITGSRTSELLNLLFSGNKPLPTSPGVDFYCRPIFLILSQIACVREMCLTSTSQITGNEKVAQETHSFSSSERRLLTHHISPLFWNFSLSKVNSGFIITKLKEHFLSSILHMGLDIICQW